MRREGLLNPMAEDEGRLANFYGLRAREIGHLDNYYGLRAKEISLIGHLNNYYGLRAKVICAHLWGLRA